MKLTRLIGNTPLVRIRKLNPNPNVTLLVKMESHNPAGSVKDRAALGMIRAALKRGTISLGDKLVEPTSGNTGIALSMIANELGFDLTLIMPENSTSERIQTVEALGAKVILEGTTSEFCRKLANKMVATGEYKSLNQYDNPDNLNCHYENTGPEIWNDTNQNITHFVSAMGTSGTIMGISKYLKEKNENVKVIGTRPLDGGPKIPGMSRWSPGFVPKIFNPSLLDGIINIGYEESIETMKRLAKEEAIFSGPSSGGNVAGAIRLANQIESGLIVTIVCDRGDRYLSSNLFSRATESEVKAVTSRR